MAKDWQVRLTDTLNYVRGIQGIPHAHFTRLQQFADEDEQVSKLISLGGARPFPTAQETRRRQALRGLLLCLVWSEVEQLIAEAKRHYQNAPENEIADAIASFFPVEGANADRVIAVAMQEPARPGLKFEDDKFYQYRRGLPARGLATHAACYESVAFWLYLGGVVSLRWLRSHGGQPGGAIPGEWAWERRIIGIPEHAQQIGAGRLIRFHRRGGAGLHYTLSVGNGLCRGNHNSSDVGIHWQKNYAAPPRRYGPAPSDDTSTFSIAGYLKCTIDMSDSDRSASHMPGALGLRVAPITPSNPF